MFLTLFINLLPLYALIGAGFCAVRILKIDRKTLANLAIYICMPVVTFGFVAQLDLKPVYVALPIVAFLISTILIISVYRIGQVFYDDNRANLLAMCASSPNTGYFGLPLIMLLFSEQWVGVYIFMNVGVLFYEATVFYYIAARGQFSAKDSLKKLVRFPTIYALLAGLFVNLYGINLPDIFLTYWEHFKGAYIVLGMMIVGAALAAIQTVSLYPKFTSLAFLGKFILWPVITALVIYLDYISLHLFSPEIRDLLIVMALLPPAANITAFAAQFNIRPEKAATIILIGTVFALFYIPFVLSVLGWNIEP